MYRWPLFRTHLVQFSGYIGVTTIHILVTTIQSTFGAPSDASLAHPGLEAREAKIYGSWKFVAINMTNMHWHWPLKIWPPMICPPILYLKLTTNAPYRIMKMLTMTCKRSPSRPSFHCTSTCILCMYTVCIYILCIHSKLYVYSVYTLCINCWAQWQLLDSGGMVDHKEIAGAWTLISNLSNSTALHCTTLEKCRNDSDKQAQELHCTVKLYHWSGKMCTTPIVDPDKSYSACYTIFYHTAQCTTQQCRAQSALHHITATCTLQHSSHSLTLLY